MIGRNRFKSHLENSCPAVDNPSKTGASIQRGVARLFQSTLLIPGVFVANQAGPKKVAVMDKSLYITYADVCWTLFFWAMLGRRGRRSADAANTVRYSFIEEHRKRANGYRDREMV